MLWAWGDAMKDWQKLTVTGALAGAANGLFGSGGGLFLVPLFLGWLHMEQKEAFATSVAVILPLSLASAVVYWSRGSFSFVQALPYFIGGLIGGIVSGRLFPRVQALWLRRGFGALLIYGGLRALLHG